MTVAERTRARVYVFVFFASSAQEVMALVHVKLEERSTPDGRDLI